MAVKTERERERERESGLWPLTEVCEVCALLSVNLVTTGMADAAAAAAAAARSYQAVTNIHYSILSAILSGHYIVACLAC